MTRMYGRGEGANELEWSQFRAGGELVSLTLRSSRKVLRLGGWLSVRHATSWDHNEVGIARSVEV